VVRVTLERASCNKVNTPRLPIHSPEPERINLVVTDQQFNVFLDVTITAECAGCQPGL